MKRQHAQNVVDRAGRSPDDLVMPANYRERRALRRMTVRGVAYRVHGLPDVWRIVFDD